jgi:hypothetical protein
MKRFVNYLWNIQTSKKNRKKKKKNRSSSSPKEFFSYPGVSPWEYPILRPDLPTRGSPELERMNEDSDFLFYLIGWEEGVRVRCNTSTVQHRNLLHFWSACDITEKVNEARQITKLVWQPELLKLVFDRTKRHKQSGRSNRFMKFDHLNVRNGNKRMSVWMSQPENSWIGKSTILVKGGDVLLGLSDSVIMIISLSWNSLSI